MNVPGAVLVDAKRVTNVRRVSWVPGDDKRVVFCQIIGRARVEFEDGTKVNAILVASTDSATLGDRYAVFFDSETNPTSNIRRVELTEAGS